MYLDSSPVRRSSETPRRRSACGEPARRTASRPVTAAARRSRLDDAIVAQWLLDQVPSDHRHAFGSASNRHELAA
jgi:hypothetical protein